MENIFKVSVRILELIFREMEKRNMGSAITAPHPSLRFCRENIVHLQRQQF